MLCPQASMNDSKVKIRTVLGEIRLGVLLQQTR